MYFKLFFFKGINNFFLLYDIMIFDSQKKSTAFATYLNMPMFPQCSHYTFLNGPPASTTNWYTHFIMATEAIKLIHVVGGKTRPTPNLSGTSIEFYSTGSAIEMVWMINFTSEL